MQMQRLVKFITTDLSVLVLCKAIHFLQTSIINQQKILKDD